jgi:hypothetical protein
MVKRRCAVIFAAVCGNFCNGLRYFLQHLAFCSIMLAVVFLLFFFEFVAVCGMRCAV